MRRILTFGPVRLSERAQYMVEFGLTFVFFIMVILATINMMLAAYNFNLAQRASWEAARKAALGGTNNEVADIIYNQYVSRMFASPFMISKPEWGENDWIVPFNEAERVQGKTATINLRYTLGFSFLAMDNIQATFPVLTRLVVIARNDHDRDNLHDRLNDPFPDDHNNNGVSDATDTDIDGDRIPNHLDRGEIHFNGVSYIMRSMRADGTWTGPATNSRISGGFMAVPRIYVLSDGSLHHGPAPLRKQAIPRIRGGAFSWVVTNIDLSHDANNNGWEDKFEAIYP